MDFFIHDERDLKSCEGKNEEFVTTGYEPSGNFYSLNKNL